ncbi:MAG: hypothetical protein MJZ20_13895 [Bacteroidaceae bacterium]|nr:hypothetical protein [Bacteroidaceae bacterium]
MAKLQMPSNCECVIPISALGFLLLTALIHNFYKAIMNRLNTKAFGQLFFAQ